MVLEVVKGLFFHEGLHGVFLIFGVEAFTEALGLVVQAFLEGKVKSAANGFFGLTDGNRGAAGDSVSELLCFVEQLFGGTNLADHAFGQSFIGLDRASGKDQFRGERRSDQTGETLGAAEAGGNAQAGFGEGKTRLF